MQTQHLHTHYSKEVCQSFVQLLYKKVFQKVLIPFSKENNNDRHKLKSNKGRKDNLINLLEYTYGDFEFNSYQIAASVYYTDLFLSHFAEKGFKFNFKFLKSIIIVSIITCHKMTCDVVYTNSTLKEYFHVDNLAELEMEYYEMVDYNINLPLKKIFEYLDLLTK